LLIDLDVDNKNNQNQQVQKMQASKYHDANAAIANFVLCSNGTINNFFAGDWNNNFRLLLLQTNNVVDNVLRRHRGSVHHA